MKKLIVLILSLFFTICPFQTSAESSSADQKDSRETTISFDLTDHDQSYTFIDKNGLETTISVTTNRLSGERTISASNTKLSLSFTIMISVNVIISAYNPSYYSSYWTITSECLTIDLSTQATYTVTCKKLNITTNKYLRVNIINGELSITYNY